MPQHLRYAANCSLLFDCADRIARVRMADGPGRHEPGAGTLELDRYLDTIAASGYTGHVALEYVPSSTTLDSLGWFPGEKAER
jgi:hydroxypyruvate isomerase